MTALPVIAITAGEPVGIGPDLLALLAASQFVDCLFQFPDLPLAMTKRIVVLVRFRIVIDRCLRRGGSRPRVDRLE